MYAIYACSCRCVKPRSVLARFQSCTSVILLNSPLHPSHCRPLENGSVCSQAQTVIEPSISVPAAASTGTRKRPTRLQQERYRKDQSSCLSQRSCRRCRVCWPRGMTLLVGRLPVGRVSACFLNPCCTSISSARAADESYLSLQAADEETVQDLAGFVTVADILEGFG